VVKVIGVDLAGSERRPTGLALIDDKVISCITLHTDNELMDYCLSRSPDLVAIDAPLTLPKRGIMRDVDRLMYKLGLKVLPPLFPGMAQLTLRGVKLSKELRVKGIKVIEVHPRSTMRRLGIISRIKFLTELKDRGYLVLNNIRNVHEVDAIIAAYTGILHLNGLTERVKGEEGEIVIPIEVSI